MQSVIGRFGVEHTDVLVEQADFQPVEHRRFASGDVGIGQDQRAWIRPSKRD